MPELSAEQEARFNAWWALYPKKIKKIPAKIVWQQISPDQELAEAIISAIGWQSKNPEWLKDDKAFCPSPENYLLDARWEDEPPPSLIPRVVAPKIQCITPGCDGHGAEIFKGLCGLCYSDQNRRTA